MTIIFTRKNIITNDLEFFKIINNIIDQYSYNYTYNINDNRIELIFIETLYSHIKYNQYENMIYDIINNEFIKNNYLLVHYH
jgi:hypothetical protein